MKISLEPEACENWKPVEFDLNEAYEIFFCPFLKIISTKLFCITGGEFASKNRFFPTVAMGPQKCNNGTLWVPKTHFSFT